MDAHRWCVRLVVFLAAAIFGIWGARDKDVHDKAWILFAAVTGIILLQIMWEIFSHTP